MAGRGLERKDRIAAPLLLRPSFDHKVWGGRRLESWGKTLPDGSVGESLESGAEAVIEGGRFDGIALGDLARMMPMALLGTHGMAAAGSLGDFPLLVKLIDAQQDLSIQVHPSDAAAPPGKRGKTEAWLILESDEGSSLVTGVTGVVDPDSIGMSIVREPVRAGDVFFVMAGTVHAIGAGVLLYEVQQTSDVTYRLYDWGRPRELHLEQGFPVIDPLLRARRVAPLWLDDWREVLVACRHFLLERATIDGSRILDAAPATCRVLTVIEGDLAIDGLRLPVGGSVVLPADIPAIRLIGHARAVVASIPDLDVDVVQPLRAAGHDDDAIQRLGVGAP